MTNLNAVFDSFGSVRSPTYVIAEIGINHEGSADICAQMIREAAKSGADAIKLQTVDADKAYAIDTLSHKIFRDAALTQSETANLFDLARELGLEPFTTSGDLETLSWVDRLDPVAHKISSGLLSCLPMVDAVFEYGRPVLMSTGMALGDEVGAALKLANPKNAQVALFQCTSIYPCPSEKLWLSEIHEMEGKFNRPCGFSDHSLGTENAMLAVAAGARLIEKHFSLDPSRASFDHHISLSPEDFAGMVDNIRKADIALGFGQKCDDADVREASNKFQRRLAAARDLPENVPLQPSDLLYLRFNPDSNAIAAQYAGSILGRSLLKSVSEGEAITMENLR